jgi:hypothetical protein
MYLYWETLGARCWKANIIFVDGVNLGSYAHRPRRIWTNLAPLSTLAAAYSTVPPPFDIKVDDILDSNRTSLPVV